MKASLRRFGALFVVALLISPAPPAGAEVTQDQLREARQRVAAKSAELEDELAVLDGVLAEQAGYERRIALIEEAIADRQREIVLSEFAAREQARAMYVSAGAATFEAAVSPEGITRLGTKDAYLDAIVDVDVDVFNQLVYLQEDHASLQGQLETLVADQEDLAAEVAALTDTLLGELEAVDSEYQDLYKQWEIEEAERRRKAEEERQRRLAAQQRQAAAASSYASSAFVDPSGRTCPVAGANTFRDSWLEPRTYRGGSHHGTDIIASRGTPLVAVESGSIWSMGWHWAGGNGLYIRGDSGDIYYYAHMDGYAGGISPGVRVGVGQTVGYVGSTGVSSIAHLHIGYQPGGGPLVNPYQLMVKLCR
jgi:murein DD-endopeptidase MepM/ murein hydrolase activator NlpD